MRRSPIRPLSRCCRSPARCAAASSSSIPSRRSAVVLAYAHGISHGELAGQLGVPLGTAKSWTRRGLVSLQECMG